MRFFIFHSVATRILLRLVGFALDRFVPSSRTWVQSDLPLERLATDPFVEEIDEDQARAFQKI